MAIFFPTRSACSITKTLRPRWPASIAQKRPAAPAPMTITSHSCIKERVQQTERKVWGQPDMKLRFTMYDENSGSAFICLQQLSHLFSEQACHSAILRGSV